MPTSNGEGYRITIGTLYQQQQEMSARIGELKQTVALMDSRLNTILSENQTLHSRLEKLEGRFNGILVGLGTGLVAGAVALFQI